MPMSVSAKLYSRAVASRSVNSDHNPRNESKIAPIRIKVPPLRSPNPHSSDQHAKPIKYRTRKKKNSSSDVIRLMEILGHPIPPDIYTSLIKECTLKADPVEALYLHSHLMNQTNFELTSPLIQRLLLMHLTCGQLDIAQKLFDEIPLKKDFISWVLIIIGCFSYSKYEAGFSFFIDMLRELDFCDFVFKNRACIIVFLCTIKACLHSTNMAFAKQIHGLLLKLGFTDELSVNISLMDFYGKFGCLEVADSMFNKLCHHSTISWTTKLVNSCRNGCFYEVIEDFKEMGKAGIKRNGFTFSSVLKACARIDDNGNCGKQVHASAIKLGLESDSFVHCGLIDMYGKYGMVRDAKRMFEIINGKTNTACWNALVMAYVGSGLFVEAIKLLYQMEAGRIQINESLITHVRIGCGSGLLRAELS